jgi:hypothetical protein
MIRTTWLRHGAPLDIDGPFLLYEESTSHGLRHGRSPVHVRITATRRGWLVDVIDAAVEQPPTPAVYRDSADGGSGLHLAARLCQVHGWTADNGREHVWARVEAARATLLSAHDGPGGPAGDILLVEEPRSRPCLLRGHVTLLTGSDLL